MAKVNGEEHPIAAGDGVDVPAGAEHNFTNTSDAPMKLYTVYAPPDHKPGTIHKTKADAEADENEQK